NAATLEDLALYVRTRTAAVLREYNVFTHVSHPRLQRVSVGKTAYVVQANFNTDVDYMQLAMSIGPNAPVREVRGVLIDPTLLLVIPVLGEHTCIRVLVLPGISLDLWDALGLVKALPLLSDLRTASPVLGRQPVGVSKHMLPAYIIENYAPRGERFRCWSIEYRCDLPVDEPVRCVLLLALACPNFDYAAVWSPSREKFMAHMKEVITTGGGFRPHKARLRRLLFGGSIYGRMRVIARQRQQLRLPVAQNIVTGTEESKRIKIAAKRKVAWQQASTVYETYSRFLELAISQRSPTRLHLVLKRMVAEHIQLGKPTGVSFELLDHCAEELLAWMLDKGNEISWRIRHRSCKVTALWILASAVAHDLRGDAAACAKALAGLALKARDVPLVLRVLRSPVISTRFLSDLYACVDSELGMNLALATAFYISAMASRQHQSIPAAISTSMLAQSSGVSEFIASSNAVASVDLPNSMLALAHLHICRSDLRSAELTLTRFDQLIAHAMWPMGALAIAIRKLLALGQSDCASRLLEVSAAKSHYEFGHLVGGQSALDSSDFKQKLLENELDVALSVHRAAVARDATTSSALPLPRAAFFAPKLKVNFGDPGVADCIERYYSQVEQLLQLRFPSAWLARRLIGEAGSWCYRLQSPAPVARVTSLLSLSTRAGDEEEVQAPQLLFDLLMPTESVKLATTLEDPLVGLESTRRALLAEYLRHGLQPPPEALAVFHSHLAANNRPEASSLATRLLPEIPPNLVSQRYSMSSLAVQAYYEHLLLSCQRQPRRLLQLFVHIMGHHGVAYSPEFLRRIVDLTVVAYLRHGYFRGMGFFRLERAIVRCVDRPRFSIEHLNQMRARFWALHMFLRRHKYVPRFKLYRWQFCVHRGQLYKLRVTAIPSVAKIKAQRISTRIQANA
ncbi:hypothetical protein IWW47_002429, partial [Coemansia sp. RSA 2052]